MTVNGVPATRYRNEPSVELGNRWAKLTAAMAELAELVAELDEIWQSLTEYAADEGVSVEVGDEYEATVRLGEKPILPREVSEPEDNAELERRLVESSFWDQVSSKDAARLRTLW